MSKPVNVSAHNEDPTESGYRSVPVMHITRSLIVLTCQVHMRNKMGKIQMVTQADNNIVELLFFFALKE